MKSNTQTHTSTTLNTDLIRYLEMNDEARKQADDRFREIEARVMQRLYFKAYREKNKERLKEYERMRYLKKKEQSGTL